MEKRCPSFLHVEHTVKKTAWQNYSNYTYSHHTAKRGGWGGQGPLFQHLHSKPVKTSVSHFFSTSSQMNCAGKSNFLFEKKLDVYHYFSMTLSAFCCGNKLLVHCWHFISVLLERGWRGTGGLARLSLQCNRGPPKKNQRCQALCQNSTRTLGLQFSATARLV